MAEINLRGAVYRREGKGGGILERFEHWREVAEEGCTSMLAVAQGDHPERRSLLVGYDGCFVAAVSGVMRLRGWSVGYQRFLVSGRGPIRKYLVQSTVTGVIVVSPLYTKNATTPF